MNMSSKLALLTATMALGAAPALALGPPSGTPIPTNPETANMPTTPGSQGSQGTANQPTTPGSQGSQGTANQPTTPGSQGSQGTANQPTTPGSQGSQGTANKPPTPGPGASLPAKSNAYGNDCQGESKTHVAGTPGTPFSKCVTDMAKLANGSTNNPRTACKDESKTHVAGQNGTPFSLCVSGGAKLLKNQAHS